MKVEATDLITRAFSKKGEWLEVWWLRCPAGCDSNDHQAHFLLNNYINLYSIKNLTTIYIL